MRYNVFTDEQVDQLFEVFRGVVDSAYDDVKKRKLQKAIAVVDQIKEKEKKSEAFDLAVDLDQILAEV